MIFNSSKASTRRWIARMFSLYRIDNAGKLDTVAEVPEVLDLCEKVMDVNTGKKGARYRVVATTAPREYLSGEAFAKMIAAQKKDGTLRKCPTNQLWALRDNKTRHVWICSPDVFVNMTDAKSKPAKSKQSNLFRVFPTAEALRQVAMAHQEFLNGDKPRGKSGPTVASITQELIAIAKKQDKKATMVERADEEDEDDPPEDLRDFSIQVGPGVYMPVCHTALLHTLQSDVTEPIVYDETAKAAAKRRPSAPKARDEDGKAAKSKSRACDDDEESADTEDEEDEDDAGRKKKRQRKQKEDNAPARSKRGRELSSVGALIDPEGGDDTEADEEETAVSSVKALGQCIKQFIRLIPGAFEKDTPTELRREVSTVLKEELPEMSKAAVDAVCAHLKVDEYDNSALVVTEPENRLSVLRAKTGVPDDLMVPAWAWPMLLHVEQDKDADIHSFLVSAQSLLARASRDWAVETTRPMTSSQLPRNNAPLFSAKLCEQAAMLERFERIVVGVLSKYVDQLADCARTVVVEHAQLTEKTAEQAAKIDHLHRQLEELAAQEQANLAKIDELEARLAAPPKGLALSLPPKKPAATDIDF